MLLEHDNGARAMAAEALGELHDERAIEPLVAALRDDDQDVASKAAFGLAALGELGGRRLLDSLQDHDGRVRGWAVTALTAAAVDGTFEGNRAIVPLQPLLHDPDVDVQRAAVQALRLLGDWTSMPTPLRPDAYTAAVYTDHGQFYFCDGQFDGDVADDSDLDWPNRWLSTGPRTFIRVSTTTPSGAVPVAIEVMDGPLENGFDGWEHVEEISLDVPSGRIACRTLFGYKWGEPAELMAPMGTYRVRLYANTTAMGVYGFGYGDYYRFVLWPAPYEAPLVLRSNPEGM